MNIGRLRFLVPLKNILSFCSPCQAAYVPIQLRTFARKPTIDPNDEPIKFTESGAIHGIADIRRIDRDKKPWYQGLVCAASIVVFLVYFCVLREENDVDQMFDKDLYETVHGLEVINLQVARRYYFSVGNSPEVSKIDARLKELGVTTSVISKE